MRLPLAAAVVLSAGALGGCITPPTSAQWLGIGFRSPEQTVATFQVAIRADEPELEYRTFSQGFRERHGITKFAWLHVREELRERYPFLRRGIVDAEASAPPVREGERATLTLVTHGYELRVGLVREDFVELYGPNGLIHDDFVPFERTFGFQTEPDGGRRVYGTFLLPPTVDARAEVVEVRVGREWKIDSLETVEPP